jgi:FtsP/CotA-like multicopper oxidase with cupredoxin domain
MWLFRRASSAGQSGQAPLRRSQRAPPNSNAAGISARHQEWQDTVLLAPYEGVDIAFVADNPGDWMFHCHVLEHQAAGMAGVIRVT